MFRDGKALTSAGEPYSREGLFTRELKGHTTTVADLCDSRETTPFSVTAVTPEPPALTSFTLYYKAHVKELNFIFVDDLDWPLSSHFPCLYPTESASLGTAEVDNSWQHRANSLTSMQ